jgi:hypothetical protein
MAGEEPSTTGRWAYSACDMARAGCSFCFMCQSTITSIRIICISQTAKCNQNFLATLTGSWGYSPFQLGEENKGNCLTFIIRLQTVCILQYTNAHNPKSITITLHVTHSQPSVCKLHQQQTPSWPYWQLHSTGKLKCCPVYVERQHLALNIQTLKLRFGTIQSTVHESIISARTAHNDPCVGKRQKLHLWSSCQDPKHKTPSA